MMMDYKQLELDFQITEDGRKNTIRRESFAKVVDLHLARREKQRQKLTSIYKEIIKSVEHIETIDFQYK